MTDETKITLGDIKTALRYGMLANGGYPRYFVMEDGEAMSFEAVRDNWAEICRAFISAIPHDQWKVVAIEVNWEDAELTCCHYNTRIPSAYGDPDLAQVPFEADDSDATIPQAKLDTWAKLSAGLAFSCYGANLSLSGQARAAMWFSILGCNMIGHPLPRTLFSQCYR